MIYALLALVIILTLLTIVMAWLLVEVMQKLDWLKLTLIPWMNSISNVINPEHK